MKLLHKTSLYLLIATLIVFIIGGVSIYFMLQAIIREEVDGQLVEQKAILLKELESIETFENFIDPKDSSVVIGEKVKTTTDTTNIFSNVFHYTPFDDELVPFRVLTFPATLNNETRMVSIYWSTIENDELREGIFFSLIILFTFIILAISILNYLSMNRLWLPFRKILNQIKVFDFRNKNRFKSVRSNIAEFQELNDELIQMTKKLTKDYFSLKEFSDNASHEMQTPLAIIQSKLELLFQDKGVKKGNLKSLNAAYQAVNRLSRLHHELNLLTRIENKEFKGVGPVQLQKLVQAQIDNFSDIMDLRHLNMESDLTADPTVQGNLYLLEILLSNLFNNAIRHNIENGTISIQLKENEFIISNSGIKPTCSTAALFERFRKSSPSSDSTGLGLALVKQICEYHQFKIRYSFQKNQHTIKITF